MKYHLDFETRSRAELSDVGAYRYAEDPSTEILMYAIATDEEGPFLWVNPKWRHVLPSHPRAEVLLHRLANDKWAELWAHNAQFERAIIIYKGETIGLEPGSISQDQWRCTAALARRAALKDSLEGIGADLGLDTQKDKTGKELIKLFSVPNKDGNFVDPSTYPEKFRQFGSYCCTDVVVEQQVHTKLLPFDLKGTVLDTFLLDVRMNDRGIPVNVAAAANARRIIDETLEDRAGEFRVLTCGLNPTQREKVKQLLAANGVELPDMKQPTLEAKLEELENKTLTRDQVYAYQVLQGYAELNYAAAKKVHVILDCVCSDGRVRGTLLYYGAGTGRWAGRLIQPQNFKKPSKKHAKVTDQIYKMICDGCSREELSMVFGNPMDAISSCIRHFIQCGLDADYAQIEARIVCWLAGQIDALEDYKSGEDQYIKLAADIYNMPVEQISNPSPERDLGKQAVLGCGFQMAWKKFQSTCLKYNIVISDELAQKAVEKFRERFDKVAALWPLVDETARKVISTKCRDWVKAGPQLALKYDVIAEIPYMLLRLPSGRCLYYPHPKVEETAADVEKNAMLTVKYKGRPFRRASSITFYGEIKNNIWGRVKTYGGKLVENATQATAADVMAHGSCVAEKRFGFEILTLIHDQGLSNRRDAAADPLFEAFVFGCALGDLPSWAAGLPVVAEAKPCPYYRK